MCRKCNKIVFEELHYGANFDDDWGMISDLHYNYETTMQLWESHGMWCWEDQLWKRGIMKGDMPNGTKQLHLGDTSYIYET